MGTDVARSDFAAEDYARFRRRLGGCLAVLRELLDRPGFGVGESTIGAELELYLVDSEGRPVRENERVLAALEDPCFTPELNRFNLEYNAPFTQVAGRPLSTLQTSIESALERLRELEPTLGVTATAIGILPTLVEGDLGRSAMSDRNRYHLLSRALRVRRGEAFRLRIAGDDPLDISSTDVTPEGAATSWQWHLRVEPREFRSIYNAAQMSVPLVLGVACNAPLFVGHRLWRETRIALFKQAVDARRQPSGGGRPPPRVSFGPGWLEGGIDELFAHEVACYPPLIPDCAESPPSLEEGIAPALHELRLHNSTVWPWNRPVYDPAGGGHVRLEQRALPAGPTVRDMLANTALSLGLILGLRESEPWREFPFDLAHDNFYRAAQEGIDAELSWPSSSGVSRRPVRELVQELLPVARCGLSNAGLEPEEIDAHLQPIEGRLLRGQTGASWQLETLRLLCEAGVERPLSRMTETYIRLSRQGDPVYLWPVSGAEEGDA